MNLIPHTDELLRSELERLIFNNPQIDPEELAVQLVDVMKTNNGIGLAANQVGLNLRVFAMDSFPETFVCFNPKIVIPGTEQVTLEEGCLSYPGLWLRLSDPKTLRFASRDQTEKCTQRHLQE
jgi:peptide deformylase